MWADCAKGVDSSRGFAYTAAGKYPECRIFETPALEAEMSDFVRRNDTNCARKSGESSCHKEYHYTDVAVQRDRYAPGLVGTRNDDIVAAVSAAIHVLAGDQAPAPFDIKGQREALLLVAHYVGDKHQPMHVGAIYLDAAGLRVDPDTDGFDPATATRGANQIVAVNGTGSKRHLVANLHHLWDAVPIWQTVPNIGPAWVARARSVPITPGAAAGWSTAWATETLEQARGAVADLSFGANDSGNSGTWTVAIPGRYAAKMNAVKERQLTLAGARLTQVLQSLCP